MLPFVSFLLHIYVGARLLPALTAWPAVFALLLAALVLSAYLMPMGIGFGARRPTIRRGASDPIIWLGWAGMGLFSSLLVLTAARDVVLLISMAAAWFMPGAIDAEALRRWSALGVSLLGFGVTLLGFANARRTAAVVMVDVPIDGLPSALHGFRIAQISDIHIGPTIRRNYLRRIVAAVNRLQADMVAITGDLVDGSVTELAAHVAPLADLSSRHGTYFVTGNHEYYSGADAWIAQLRKLGIRVLLNSHIVLRHGDSRSGTDALAVVAGVTDYNAGHFDPAHRTDPQAAMAGAPGNAGVRLLLAHQPRSAEAAAAAGFDLQLSGHTHGGQFLPWNFFVRFQQPFVAGLHRLKNLWVYTSRGTGYWGPPKRFGAPSEITLLRLVTA
ncbi:MAG: metallophosphoesterase [Herminiimonas sp.]|nr:metallophosphoesterase [Herminiimonas sp.]